MDFVGDVLPLAFSSTALAVAGVWSWWQFRHQVRHENQLDYFAAYDKRIELAEKRKDEAQSPILQISTNVNWRPGRLTKTSRPPPHGKSNRPSRP